MTSLPIARRSLAAQPILRQSDGTWKRYDRTTGRVIAQYPGRAAMVRALYRNGGKPNARLA